MLSALSLFLFSSPLIFAFFDRCTQNRSASLSNEDPSFSSLPSSGIINSSILRWPNPGPLSPLLPASKPLFGLCLCFCVMFLGFKIFPSSPHLIYCSVFFPQQLARWQSLRPRFSQRRFAHSDLGTHSGSTSTSLFTTRCPSRLV
jgi:hypothetical protein